jgi:hypothetical protein
MHLEFEEISWYSTKIRKLGIKINLHMIRSSIWHLKSQDSLKFHDVRMSTWATLATSSNEF